MTRRSFVSLAACSVLRGQTSQQRGREIIDKVIYALGGDGFRNMTTRTETGRAFSFYGQQLTGLSIARIITKYYPDEMKQRQMFGKKFDDIVLLSRKSAWEITFRGARALPEDRPKQFEDAMLHDVFYILRNRLAEPGMTFEAHGSDVVENQPVYTIEIYDSENRNVTVWVHQDTYLPIKQRFKRWDPIINDRREEITYYTKYRDAGNGVQWPFDVQKERDGQKTYELYAEKVTIGDPVPDSQFELPAGITILKKK